MPETPRGPEDDPALHRRSTDPPEDRWGQRLWWLERFLRDLSFPIAFVAALGMVYAVAVVEQQQGNQKRQIERLDELAHENRMLIRRINHETEQTARQFCLEEAKIYVDKVRRTEQTRTYLRSPAGRRTDGSTGGLNDYIRQFSLPQTVKELARERRGVSSTCRPIFERQLRIERARRRG